MSYQLTYPVEVPSELAAGFYRRWQRIGVDLAEDRVEVEEHAGLARGRIDAVNHARPVDRPPVGLLPSPREIAYSPLPNTPPGPAARRTMSPPNEESGVNSATEVIGADVEIFVAVVFCVTVTVPRSASVCVVAAVNVAATGKCETKGASRLRFSSGRGFPA